jgi:hypothetical protein
MHLGVVDHDRRQPHAHGEVLLVERGRGRGHGQIWRRHMKSTAKQNRSLEKKMHGQIETPKSARCFRTQAPRELALFYCLKQKRKPCFAMHRARAYTPAGCLRACP